MNFLENSENVALTQTLNQAINLGLITAEQAKVLCAQHNEEEVMLLLEQIASEQMSAGHQCIGGQCML